MSEWNRILFVQERDGMVAAREFVKRTYAKYKECLRMTGPKHGRKLHHASLPQFRRGFVESCLAFRDYLRKTRWMDLTLTLDSFPRRADRSKVNGSR